MKKSFAFLVCVMVFLSLTACSETTEILSDDYSEYTWEQALMDLHKGNVESVAQSHDLTVRFYLENGEQFSVKEPFIDAIFEEVKNCGKPCTDMELITE